MKCYSEQIADLALKKSGLGACRTLPDQAFHTTIEQDVINKPSHYQGRYWIFQMMICHFREKKE